MPLADTIAEAERVMVICNACRYCEGHCAVFRAMELRTEFPPRDLRYLANLCHACGSCYHHCQYAPPHAFAVNVPATFAELREQSYGRYAWPRALAGLFRRSGVTLGVAAAASAALVGALVAAPARPQPLSAPRTGAGAFYAIVPHDVLVAVFVAAAAWAAAALTAGVVRFWRDAGEGALRRLAAPRALSSAAGDALTLRYLDGGGDGCTYPQEAPSHARRWFHHLTFYGFLLDFAATAVAALWEYALGRQAPYPRSSLPVVLGTAGGLALLAGTAGLLWLKARSDPGPNDRRGFGMDVAFLVLLFLSSATGLLLLALRETGAMGALLGVHLAVVLTLFVTLPYGKFVHAAYRLAALVRYALERSRPPPIQE